MPMGQFPIPSSLQALQGWASPSEGAMRKSELERAYDEHVRQEREAEDIAALDEPNIAGPDGTIQQAMNRQWNRTQQDSASGPQGFNRQWVPFFEALRGSKVNMNSLVKGLPSSLAGLDKKKTPLTPWSLG